tara:strand:+ start:1254 stop:1595 length:342 start_codon:yes stop_codon:yes gene_type:complete
MSSTLTQTQEYYKLYYINNKEKINERQYAYYQEYKTTDAYFKRQRIRRWKSRGVVAENWENLYELFLSINNCEVCNKELQYGIYGNNKKCLDHDHTTGEYRNILCNTCNLRRH